MRIIGAGVGRTGTHSLKVALERLLGGPCHHMMEVFRHPDQIPVWHRACRGEKIDWPSFLRSYRATVDWPGAAFWRPLAEAFPDAPILLSTRSPESWYRSASNTIFQVFSATNPAVDPQWLAMATDLIYGSFCDTLEDPVASMAAFERHNDEVRRTIPSHRLVEWTPTDGWAPLCRALNLPIPDEPFPLTNTTNEFREHMGLPPI